MERLKYSAVEWDRACRESAERAERARAKPRRQWAGRLLFIALLALLAVVPAMAAVEFLR